LELGSIVARSSIIPGGVVSGSAIAKKMFKRPLLTHRPAMAGM
jgi:hypothetical protein